MSSELVTWLGRIGSYRFNEELLELKRRFTFCLYMPGGCSRPRKQYESDIVNFRVWLGYSCCRVKMRDNDAPAEKLLIPISPISSSYKHSLKSLHCIYTRYTAMPQGYYLPRTLENWKWPRRINPHHNEVHLEAIDWIKSFKALRPQTQEAIDRCDFSTSSYICLDHVH